MAFQDISDKLQQSSDNFVWSPSLEAIPEPETLQFISKDIFEIE